jgi:hypothetical protein
MDCAKVEARSRYVQLPLQSPVRSAQTKIVSTGV